MQKLSHNMLYRIGVERETRLEAGLILVVAVGIPVYETASIPVLLML